MQATVEDITRALVRRKIEELITPLVQAEVKAFTEDEENKDCLRQIVTDEAQRALQLEAPVEPQFKSVVEFVDRFIRPMYPATAATMSRTNWSAHWYKHGEVVARLEALWVTYEAQRRTGGDGFLEAFLRVHCDYHMRQIMSETGVFAECSTEDVKSIPLPTARGDNQQQNTNEIGA